MTLDAMPENFIAAAEFYYDEKQCESCTHYSSEHIEDGPCSRTLGHIVNPDEVDIQMIHPSIKCNCKKFSGDKS